MPSHSFFIKKMLKNRFGQDFSVTGGRFPFCYTVKYTDGVSKKEVKEFLKQFIRGHYDHATERYIVTNEDGIVDHIHIEREMSSKAKNKVISEIKKKYGREVFSLSLDEQRRELGKPLEFVIQDIFDEMNF